MREITAYMTEDGKIFKYECDAKSHTNDIVGEAFDGLLLIGMRATGGNVTRSDQHRMALSLLNNRDEAAALIRKLDIYLNGGE